MNPHLRAMNTNNTSGYPGVTRHSDGIRWKAFINGFGPRINLGAFDTAVEASKERDKRIRELQRAELLAA